MTDAATPAEQREPDHASDDTRAVDDGGELPSPSGLGGGRRRTLAAIERKDRLEPADGFGSVDEPEPDYCESRVQLGSDFLAELAETKLDELDVEHETLAEVRADLFGGGQEAR